MKNLAIACGISVQLLCATCLADQAGMGGRISGVVDGQTFDAAARCVIEKRSAKDWIAVSTDPMSRGNSNLDDLNGDGVVIEVSGVIGDRVAFRTKLAGKEYSFGGTPEQLDDQGLKFESQMYRADKETRKMVPSYKATVSVDCGSG